MKKILCGLLAAVLSLGFAPSAFAQNYAEQARARGLETQNGKIVVNDDISVSADYDWTRLADQKITLNVYNWGLYISDGSDESVDILSAFEKLTGIELNYTTYDSNESMYAKIKSGGASYDVVVPSDYMVGKLIQEDMLAPLDYKNIAWKAAEAFFTYTRKKNKGININIEKSEMVDINNNIKSIVNGKVLELSKKYPLDTLDPYTNPFLLLGGRFQVSQTYNNDIMSFINSMKEYYQREISHNVYSKVFAKVEFHLLGKGRKVCSNLHITVKFEGELNHIYAANSLTTQVGYKDKEPKRQSESHFQGLFLTAPDKEKYNYNEWDLIHQENIIAVNVQRVTPGVVDTSSIPYFYIDTRYNQHIHINWKINGDDIKESGKTGTLEIVVK